MVNRGDRLDIAANDWNAVLEHLKQAGGGRICNAPAAAAGADEILICNAGTATISPFEMVRIDDVLRPEAAVPADFLLGRKMFSAQNYFDIAYAFSDTAAVAQEEIPSGGVGRASVAPIAACYVDFSQNGINRLDAPAVTPHINAALPTASGLKIIAADRTAGSRKWAIVDLREKIGFAPDTFFKLSRRVELIESGGVQVETKYCDITNPARIFAFGGEFQASGGSVAVQNGQSVYLELDYINSGGAVRYVTSPSINSALHPAVLLGKNENGKITSKFNSYENPYMFHPRNYTPQCVPILSGGSAAVLIKESYTDLPGSGYTIASAAFAESTLTTSRTLVASASYDSTTSSYTARWSLGTNAGNAGGSAYVAVGECGRDNIDAEPVKFAEKYFI